MTNIIIIFNLRRQKVGQVYTKNTLFLRCFPGRFIIQLQQGPVYFTRNIRRDLEIIQVTSRYRFNTMPRHLRLRN